MPVLLAATHPALIISVDDGMKGKWSEQGRQEAKKEEIRRAFSTRPEADPQNGRMMAARS